MYKPHTRTKIQQNLSWKLKCIMGARANLYPCESTLPEEVKKSVRVACEELKYAEILIRNELKGMKDETLSKNSK